MFPSIRSALPLALMLGVHVAGVARAELLLDLRGGTFTPMPIAIADCTGDTPQQSVAAIITNNLQRSGVFAPVEKARQPAGAVNVDAVPDAAAWRASGAQALVTCRVAREGSRTRADFRLWDLGTGEQVTAERFTTEGGSWRRVGHLISDAVFAKITGEGGFFDTRVVFVDESGPKERRRKRLAIVDQDGGNFTPLSTGEELVVTPRFAPDADRIAFMGFTPGTDPRVYVVDLATGQRQSVVNAPGMSFSPRFSPDGTTLVTSIQEGSHAHLHRIDLRTRAITRLTSGLHIDTSPAFSPDGREIVFESNRGGGQQLYIMPAGGGGARRISFGEGRYSTPVWSPKGDLIAFTRQRGNSFAVGVMRPDGSGERILTEGFHNEGPTFAPNGRYLMFFRDPGGQAGPRLFMVDVLGRQVVPVPTPGFASDPAWGPLQTAAR